MPHSASLPVHFPAGTKYVLESHGTLVRRYVEFPGGRRTELEPRSAVSCVCLTWQQIGIVPDLNAISTSLRSQHTTIEDDGSSTLQGVGVFEPAMLSLMGEAYDQAVQSLIEAPSQSVREAIASKILALAKRAINDQARARRRATV